MQPSPFATNRNVASRGLGALVFKRIMPQGTRKATLNKLFKETKEGLDGRREADNLKKLMKIDGVGEAGLDAMLHSDDICVGKSVFPLSFFSFFFGCHIGTLPH